MAALETEIRAAGELGMSASEIPILEMRRWKGAGFTDLHIADALAGFPASGFKSLPEDSDEDAVMGEEARIRDTPQIPNGRFLCGRICRCNPILLRYL